LPNRKLQKVALVTYPDTFTLEEAKSLVESADRNIVGVFTQKYMNHSEYGVGSGKAQELKEFVKESNAEQIIVDEHLTSKQINNLEKLTGVQVIDRERLILDIFYARATTNEAKLQIQLAEIKYNMPRVREIAKMSSGKERAGKGGSGEYTVDVKFRDQKRQMGFIKEKLDETKRKRALYHQQRIKTGMPVVSLVGYTSSGKTTLFNLLTSENKQTSSSLFTTLSTTTRALKADESRGDKKEDTLLTDTVGFISRLPPYMLEAFKSTLEESLGADLILLLIDASEDIREIRIKYTASWQILEELKVDKSKVLVVFTKFDRLPPMDAEIMIEQTANDVGVANQVIVISSKNGHGIRKLKTTIDQRTRI
jgi:GTP-binding protein HflX